MAKYKVGDVVKIVELPIFINSPERNTSGKMDHWAGKTMTIREVTSRDRYYMKEDVGETSCNMDPGWIWNETMIECLVNIDFNNITNDDLISFLERGLQ